MKHNFDFLFIAVLVACMSIFSGCKSSDNGNVNDNSVSNESTLVGNTSDEVVSEVSYVDEKNVEHEYVDLGLSVKWAKTNIGATNPEDCGVYFAWGETSPKNDFTWGTYKLCQATYSSDDSKFYVDSFTKYPDPDEVTTLESADDAATACWGDGWSLPTYDEMQELLDKCTWEWTEQNNVNGYRVTGKNGNSIFLPVAGFRNGTKLFGASEFGNYLSKSLSYDNYDPYLAWYLYFDADSKLISDNERFVGMTVRPVRK